ncbi:MAG: hypothetical protein RLZZ299_2717, partial [Pseudomonadota bacterium]
MRPTILHTPLLVSLAWLVACSGDEKDTGATDTGTATDTATASDTGTGSDTDTGSGTDTATNTATATATDTGVEPENQAPAFNAVADVTTYATSAVSVQVRDGDTSAGVATSTDVATMLVSLAEGEAASVRVDVADPEGGTIELQLGGSCDSCGVESWVRLVEGTLWLTPLHRDAGEYVVYVTARDPEGATTTLEFPVHVDNVVRVRRVYDNYPLGGGTAVDEVHPTWSPDSTQVAFSGNPGQNADIFVMSALAGEPFTDTNQDGIRGPGEPFADLDMSLGYDGPGVPQRLTNFDGSVGTHEDIDGGAADVEPAWSPDGSTIAFASNRGDGRYRIFRMADDGSGQTALFDGSFGRAPAWAPTGASTSRQLAYARSVSDGADLVVTDLEPAVGPGGNPELRASTPEVIVAIPDVGEFEGVWTPEGIEPARVAFVSDRAGPRALWVYTPSTGDLRALTPAGGEDARPCWSPDGTWLAFERDEGGARDVWAVDAAGDGLVNLTGELDGEQREPAWSPDGAWIAFADDSGASWDLWKMSVDTSAALVAGDAVQLTRDEMGPAGPILRDDRAPSWAPDGSFLVFSGALDGGAADLYEAWTDGVDDIDLPVVEEVTEAVWSPDHTRLAFVRTCPADAVTCTPGASAVWVYDAWAATPQDALQPASPRTRFAGSPPVAQAVLAEVGGPAWSPDGRFLMYHTDQDEGEADGRGVMHLRVYDVDTRVDADVVDPEDVDGDGRLDVDEDVDGDGRRDAAEDQDDDDHLDVDEDVDNDGRRDAAEDLDGDGRRDVAEDVDGDGRRDVDEDVDGDGRRDVDEDADRDQELDDGEDVDGDGRLDAAEPDLDGDGRLDDGEDLDGDGRLDAAELDLDGDGRLDVAEPDADADGRLDGAAEDLDGDGRLDVDEDLDGDGRLDIDEDVNGDGRLGL